MIFNSISFRRVAGITACTTYPLIAALLAVCSHGAAASLCDKRESVVFECSIGKKMVAVCAENSTLQGVSHVQYRYGVKDHLELVYPKNVQSLSSSMAYSRKAYASGGEQQINFSDNGYDYSVFDRSTRTGFRTDGQHDTQFTSGLVVKKNGRIILSHTCLLPRDAAIAPAAETILKPLIR